MSGGRGGKIYLDVAIAGAPSFGPPGCRSRPGGPLILMLLLLLLLFAGGGAGGELRGRSAWDWKGFGGLLCGCTHRSVVRDAVKHVAVWSIGVPMRGGGVRYGTPEGRRKRGEGIWAGGRGG